MKFKNVCNNSIIEYFHGLAFIIYLNFVLIFKAWHLGLSQAVLGFNLAQLMALAELLSLLQL